VIFGEKGNRNRCVDNSRRRDVNTQISFWGRYGSTDIEKLANIHEYFRDVNATIELSRNRPPDDVEAEQREFVPTAAPQGEPVTVRATCENNVYQAKAVMTRPSGNNVKSTVQRVPAGHPAASVSVVCRTMRPAERSIDRSLAALKSKTRPAAADSAL